MRIPRLSYNTVAALLLLLQNLTTRAAAKTTITSTATITNAALISTITIFSTAALDSSNSPSSSSSSSQTSTSAPATTQSPQDQNQHQDQTFIATVLNSTNTHRTPHNASALTWNTTLATYAATHIATCKFSHTGGPYGENLARGYENVTAAIDAWAAEGKRYQYVRGGRGGGFSEQTGHFTQLVWKATSSVGCAWKDCGAGAGGDFLFCEYWPPGNVEGQYAAEVQAPVGVCEGEACRVVKQIEAHVNGASGGRRSWGGLWAVAVVGGLVVIG